MMKSTQQEGKPMSIKIFIFTIFLALACNKTNKALPFTENILTKGMKITAQTPIEKLIIEGLEGTKRRFIGEKWSKVANLIPRQSRWYGSLGLYDPARSSTQEGRLLINEGRQFFKNENEALRFLCNLRKSVDQLDKLTYSSNGLVISYHITPVHKVKNINIWQIYINGKKPTALKGADNHAIEVTAGIIPDTATPHPIKIGYPRELCSQEAFQKSNYWQRVLE